MLTESYIPASMGTGSVVTPTTRSAPRPALISRCKSSHGSPNSSAHRRSLEVVCDGASSAYYRLTSSGEDSVLETALASLEYNRATARISGSIAVRNSSALPIEVVVQYSTDAGLTFAEAYAQLLFCSAGGANMDLDMYAFSLRASSISPRFGRDVAQTICLRVAAKVGGDMLAMDDQDGRLYCCKAVPADMFQ